MLCRITHRELAMAHVVPEPSAVFRMPLAPLPRAERIISVDLLRGLVMAFMAIDHTRDFLSGLPFEPESIAHTWPALFFTRWITHFCAPMFFFLAGTGAFLYRNRTGSLGRISRFLWTRGLWLIFLEWTVIEFAWTFVPWTFGGVIWSLGCSMVVLAALVWLPERIILGFGIALICLHDLFDSVKSAQLGSFAWIWPILHRRGMVPHTHFFVLFPLIPWVGVMAAGYAFGRLLLRDPRTRQRLTFVIGATLTACFIVLRAFNIYGNPPAGVAASTPGAWHPLPSLAMTIVSFLDVEKYPPSLQFLLMTIGPSLMLLSFLDRVSAYSPLGRMLKPLLVFGRVPLFFYILHLYVIHLLAIAAAYVFRQPVAWLWHGSFWMNQIPEGYGHGLPFIYAMWALVLVILYFPCSSFADLKQRKRTWWLSYL
jgi:uncharacterized membrane protein